MNINERIDLILSMDKFSNLSDKQKMTIKESIIANSLILSSKNVDKFLSIIENNVRRMDDLGIGNYQSNGICYEGIVETSISNKPIDSDGAIFPFIYDVKFKEFQSPLGRLTKSVLHEFGHLTVKKDNCDTTKVVPTDTGLLIDCGGLVISENLKNNFGHFFTENLNEMMNFYAFKASLAYNENEYQSLQKMKIYAEKMGINVEEQAPAHLRILPQDLFSNYTEYYLSNDVLPEGTKNMFNPLYTKFTPLVRLIMNSFQNPCYSYQDLKKQFEVGKGFDAEINSEPVNDLLYGYYNSSFHTMKLFDDIMKGETSWKDICISLDNQLLSNSLDPNIVDQTVDCFLKFYQKRNELFLSQGKITQEMMDKNMQQFYNSLDECKNMYHSRRNNKM